MIKLTSIVLMCLGSVMPEVASAAGPKTSLLCTTKAGVTLPTKDKARLAEPVFCIVSVDSDGVFKATLVSKTRGKTGPDHASDLSATSPLKVELVPGADYFPCVDFEVQAQLVSDSGKTLWQKSVPVKQDCKVKKVKAELACTTELGGKSVTLPTKGDPKLDGPIKCQIVTTDERVLEVRPTLEVARGSAPAVVKAGSVTIDNGKYIFNFTLTADVDYESCGEPVTLTGEVVEAQGGIAFEKSLTLRQKCPVAPAP